MSRPLSEAQYGCPRLEVTWLSESSIIILEDRFGDISESVTY